VTPSAPLTAALSDGETVLWQSPAKPSARLADYGGIHDWIGRLFFGISAITALVFFRAMQDAGRMSMSVSLLIWVAGPVVIGLLIRHVGRRRKRKAAQATTYAVTSRRVLAIGDATQGSYPISPDTIAKIALEAADREVLEYTDVASSAAPAHIMYLPKGEAAKAQAAIAQAQANL